MEYLNLILEFFCCGIRFCDIKTQPRFKIHKNSVIYTSVP